MKMYNGGQWTQGRYNTFVKGVLRSGSQRWPPRFTALTAAKRGKRVNKMTGRMAEHYECASCNDLFPAKSVIVDHIEPIVPVTGFTTWDEVIARLFCEVDNLQILCKECHKSKSAEERVERKLHKDNNNNKDLHEEARGVCGCEEPNCSCIQSSSDDVKPTQRRRRTSNKSVS